ncbi:MAG: hypothetical protein LBR74_06095 [Eubacterium sp.]|jgi:hypothetical protein|nr:hypothetical protein [Eubacterium sp.]
MFKKKKKSEVMKKPMEIVLEMSSGSERADPNGSYTGIPVWKNEKPVQDADDI